VWAGSGNVAAPSSLVDDSQLGGSSYANQAIDFDNTRVNTSLFTFEK
jgi:hypothetical protein